MKRTINSKKGFTIIEVVLVLAIAGLIFLMVFTALPALQRSQRDTQRGNDIGRLVTALSNYQSNNRNRTPSGLGVYSAEEVANETTGKLEIKYRKDGSDMSADELKKTTTWGYFYKNYLIVEGSGGSTDDFSDPNGSYYALAVAECAGTSDSGAANILDAGSPCVDAVQRNDVTWDEQANGEYSTDRNGSGIPNAIGVVLHASCDGEVVAYSGSARNIAFVYKNEGGGTTCRANN